MITLTDIFLHKLNISLKEWRRASVIRKISDKNYEVYFFDYGFSEEVNSECFRKLHQSFAQNPIQAFVGKLVGIQEQNKWSSSAISFFRRCIKKSNKNVMLALPSNSIEVNYFSKIFLIEIIVSMISHLYTIST